MNCVTNNPENENTLAQSADKFLDGFVEDVAQGRVDVVEDLFATIPHSLGHWNVYLLPWTSTTGTEDCSRNPGLPAGSGRWDNLDGLNTPGKLLGYLKRKARTSPDRGTDWYIAPWRFENHSGWSLYAAHRVTK